MNTKNREPRSESLSSRIFAVLVAAVAPLVTFYVLLSWPWDFAAQPSWSWTTIAAIPLASWVFLFLPNDRASKVARLACTIVATHAAAMIGMLIFGVWRPVAGIALFLDLLLLAAFFRPALGLLPGALSKSTIFWVAAIFGLGIPLALANTAVVAWRAEAIAGGRQYCIQYSSQTDPHEYEPARTLFDLSALKMHARLTAGGSSTFHFTHHGVLVIDTDNPEFLNWSYRQVNFVDEVSNRKSFKERSRAYLAPKIVCQSRTHYVRNLPAWSPDTADYETTIKGRRFAIPQDYRPRMNRDSLAINAVAPNFDAYNRTIHRLPTYYSDIIIRDANYLDISSFLNIQTGAGEAATAEPEYGLKKTVVYARAATNDAKRSLKEIRKFYTAYDDGRLVRFIVCDSSNTLSPHLRWCRHMFIADGLIFQLMIPDASQWQIIEQKLARKFASFEKTL